MIIDARNFNLFTFFTKMFFQHQMHEYFSTRKKIFQQPKIAFTKKYADMISVNEAQT